MLSGAFASRTGPWAEQKQRRVKKRCTTRRDGVDLQLAAPLDPNGFVQDAATPPIRIFLLTGAWQPLTSITGSGLYLPNLMQIC